jgi:4-hydroxybenzoyl-CoA thioesterase
MPFTTQTKVRFSQVDAAGIVFFPRYFEMLNAAVEDWFAEMGMDFKTMHTDRHMGVPTVKLDCEFLAPSRLGDALTITIRTTDLGRSSCAVAYSVTGADGERMRATAILVCMDTMSAKAIPWPDALRSRMIEQQLTP